MAEIIEMPLMSDTMTEGVIASWQKKVGDKVKAGEVIAEIETDKATMDLESYFDGVLLYTAADAGGAIKVGDLLAIIGKDGEDANAILSQYKASKGGSPATPEPSPAPATNGAASTVSVVASAPATPQPAAHETSDSRVKASPLAKMMAEQQGININQLSGSGDGGRIVKRDIEAALSQAPTTPAHQEATTSVTYQPTGAESYEDVNLSQMRKTIARRLGESKFAAPHYYLTMEIEMSKVMKLRAKLNEESATKLSINDFIVKACALALRKNPKVNASWLGDKIRYYHYIHIGVAVAIEDGLVVPVIRFADAKGLEDISAETKALATKAKNKELQPEEFKGNTFTISNLGMYGIDQFTAIINPPDSCILAVGGIQSTPQFKDKNGKKKVVESQIMKVTLSCDHRSVDGAVGSEFLKTLKSLLENPLRMLL